MLNLCLDQVLLCAVKRPLSVEHRKIAVESLTISSIG